MKLSNKYALACRGALFALMTCSFGSLNAFAPSNFFHAYDSAIRMSKVPKKNRESLVLGNFQIGAMFEVGSKKNGRNWDDNGRNILQLHDDTQSTLQMIKESVGTDLDTKIKNLFGGLMTVPDTNNIGHIQLTGDFQEWDINLHGSYRLPIKAISGDLTLSVYVPVIHKEIKDVSIKDLTSEDPAVIGAGNVVGAIRVKDSLTSKIKEKVKELGDLDLSNWDETGLGDIAVMLAWQDTYRQDKDYLKKVTLHAKVGVSLPSSKEKDEDKAFSMPLGYDGAFGLPLAMGLELDFINRIKAGLDVDFLVLFDKSRIRRLKTNEFQSEFLLLNKGQATMEYGLTWQFHLYLQAFHFWKGLSAGASYQFVKRDDDRLNPRDNDFNFGVVNSARSLKEKCVHNILFKVNYDFFDDSKKDGKNWSALPQISLFYKLSAAGKNIIHNDSFGGQLAINF